MAANRSIAVVLALAVVVALAGGVTPPPEQRPDLTEPVVTVEGGEPPVDPATIYRRVADLHGIEYATLPDVTVVVADRADLNLTELSNVTPFERLLGIEPRARDLELAGLARPGKVSLYTDVVETPAAQERVLAHEFAHVVQFHQDAFGTVDDRIDGSGANESRLRNAVTEGAASYVERRYAAEYMDADPARSIWAERRANLTQYEAFVLAPYHFGERYVDSRIDSPAALPSVYDDPPRTSEQLLHGGSEPPAPLSVRVDGRSVRHTRTKGELFVRLALEGELDPDRAAEAAAGWGKDRLLALEGGNYVWALRWDDPADADEFEAAMRDFLDAHAGDPEDGRWRAEGVAYRVQRVSDETVVVLVGGDAFVQRADVSGTDGEVTVDASGDAGAAPAARGTADRAPPEPVTP